MCVTMIYTQKNIEYDDFKPTLAFLIWQYYKCTFKKCTGNI